MTIVVPFLDVGATYRELADDFDEAYRRVMESGWYLLGPELERFEQEWATYCGVESCAGVASGLDALILGLRALDVGPGDEVIVPSNTYIATWLAVSAVGAQIVPVEPDIATYNLTAEAVKHAISPRTAAILPVHLYGRPADVVGIDAISRRTGIPVLYDGAQAHGARVEGRNVGSFGTVTAWSFYPGKNLGAFADAGAVTSDDCDLISRVKRLRNYGSEVKYLNVERGVNSRLDELQAAALSVKLRYLDSWNDRRRAQANVYIDGLSSSMLIRPVSDGTMQSAWHLFVVRSDNRDRLQLDLAQLGIETLIHYPVPPHLQEAYPGTWRGPSNTAELLAGEVLSLPIGPHLSRLQLTRVVDSISSLSDRSTGPST